ncbi:MAG: M1 family aminopeptidase [Kangiellaceae bacterium]
MQALRIALFEFKYSLSSVPFIGASLLFFSLGFLLTANAGEFTSVSNGEVVLANSPFSITHLLIRISMLATFVVPSFIANTIIKDTRYKFDSILFSTPISEKNYLSGRFLGGFAALSISMFLAPLGMYLGVYWPWAEQSLLGPNSLSTYLSVYGNILLPSIFVVSTFIFLAVVVSQKMIYAYLSSMLLLGLFSLSAFNDSLSAHLDPFMLDLFMQITEYWTVIEFNKNTVAYSAYASNRIIWISIGVFAFALSLLLFGFDKVKSVLNNEQVKKAEHDLGERLTAKQLAFKKQQLLLANEQYSASVNDIHNANNNRKEKDGWLSRVTTKQFGLRCRHEMLTVFKSIPFVILVGFSLLMMWMSLTNREIVHGVLSLPLTSVLIDSFSYLVPAYLGVIIFYTAEIFWRERGSDFSAVVDATPTPNWVFVLSKLVSLLLVIVVIKLMGILLAITVQLSSGYYHFEFELYFFVGLLYDLIPFFCLAILASLFNVLANSRMMGMAFFGLFMLAIMATRDLFDWDHPLISFALPVMPSPMSEMNGYFEFFSLGIWARIYWIALAGIFLMMVFSAWPRGQETSMLTRLKSSLTMNSKESKLAFSGLLMMFVAAGAYIYYNVSILNHHMSKSEKEFVQAEYEKKYIGYSHLPMPKITAVSSRVDLFPSQRKFVVNSELTLTNQTAQTINEIHFSFPVEASITNATLPGAKLQSKDPRFKYFIFTLDTPMLPGHSLAFQYSLATEYPGFSGGSPSTNLVKNGSFIMSTHTDPSIGLQTDYLLKDNRTRKNYGLDDIKQRARLENTAEHNNSVIRPDSDFIRFETLVSTEIGQTAISVGNLVDEWQESGRHYFQYQASVPITNFVSYLSANYQIKRKMVMGVEAQIFYHPNHDHNIERMMAGIVDSLAYYSEAFGGYPYQQARLVEFPGYQNFAKAFPGTITFSESFGFSADVREGELDMPYYIVALEMAHQWWGNQVIAANVEGDGFIHESFSQYAALMVMEKTFGKIKVKKFLEFELERYLTGRAKDHRGENPLARVASQKYIHYGKGALVLYALKQKIGEEKLNDIFKQFFQQRAFSSKPYATSLDFIALLKNNIEERYHPLVVDLFEKITLYDLEIIDALVTPLKDGRFQVTVDVKTRKLYADKFGEETVQPFDDEIEFGLFSASPSSDKFSEQHILQMETVKISSEKTQLKMIVTERPKFVAIDPFFHFIERERENNVMSLSE